MRISSESHWLNSVNKTGLTDNYDPVFDNMLKLFGIGLGHRINLFKKEKTKQNKTKKTKRKREMRQ